MAWIISNLAMGVGDTESGPPAVFNGQPMDPVGFLSHGKTQGGTLGPGILKCRPQRQENSYQDTRHTGHAG